MKFRSMFFQGVVVLMIVLIFSTGFAYAEGVSGPGYELLKNALGIGENKPATQVISMSELLGKPPEYVNAYVAHQQRLSAQGRSRLIIAGVAVGILAIIYIAIEEREDFARGLEGGFVSCIGVCLSGCIPDSGLRDFGCLF